MKKLHRIIKKKYLINQKEGRKRIGKQKTDGKKQKINGKWFS